MPLYFLTNCRMQCDTMERPLLFLSVLKMTPDIYRGDSAGKQIRLPFFFRNED
jgi:hypothetical protein